LNIGYVFILFIGQAVQNTGRVMDGPNELYLWDIKFFGSLKNDIPRDTLIAKFLGYLFGNRFPFTV